MKKLDCAIGGQDVLSEITRDCLLTRTRRIARVLTNLYDQELRPFGINSPQFTLLVVISKLGPVSRAEIGRRNHQERSTLTRNLQLILSMGWVEEVEEQISGRSRPIALTPAGKKLLLSAVPAWQAAQKRAKVILGKSGVAAIINMADDVSKQVAAGV